MASSPIPAPSTPEYTTRRIPMNRAVTLPPNLSAAFRPVNPPAATGTAEDIEWLYFHPSVSIFKFTARSTASSPSGRPQSAGAGTLAWASPTERNVAAGQLEIYRGPESLVFLRSGTFLQTLLPRSNCWCVDGKSKFALRIAPDIYLRIELPGETEEDLEEVESFTAALNRVLFYERSPCPFSRTFTVDLPEEQPEVRKKRKKSLGPAKKWKLAGGHRWKPEDGSDSERKRSEDSGSSAAGSEDESDRDDGGTDKTKAGPSELAVEVKKTNVSTPPSARSRGLAALRSITSPPQLAWQSSPSPSRLRARVDVDGSVQVSEVAGGHQSRGQVTALRLRTYQEFPTDMPPSPPDSSAGLEYVESQGGADDDRIDDSEDVEDRQSRGEERAAASPDRGAESGVGTRDETYANKSTIVGDNLLNEERPPRTDGAANNDTSMLANDPELACDRREQLPDDLEINLLSNETEESPEAFLQHLPLAMVQAEITADVADDPQNSGSEQPSHPEAVVPEHGSEAAPSEHQQSSERTVIDAYDDDDRPTTPTRQITPEDPYAAIQARILARRSIGGTTSFYPNHTSPTRHSTSSTSSSTTLSSNKSAVSRRSHSSQRQQAFATAMVKKACSVFLGPPAHLVAIMLHIAARFANSTFGVNSMFYVESPMDERGSVPGSYRLEVDGEETLNDDGSAGSDWEEDDFGVPLRSPVRLAGREGLRDRRGWDVD